MADIKKQGTLNNKMNTEEESRHHKLPGEYVYDDVIYCKAFPKEVIERVKNNFQLRHDDIIVATYPKSGTTWVLEIVWLIMNDVDVTKANEVLQDTRVPFLEMYRPGETVQNIDRLEKADSPRIFKTHLSYKILEKQLTTKSPKVILGARNVKDNLVSYYHFYKMNAVLGRMTGPFSEFFELFKEKHLSFGDWFDNILDYWNNRHDINFLLVKYEDLHKDLHVTVKRIADFLGKELSNVQILEIEKHVAFDRMKTNDKVNKVHTPVMDHSVSPFMRKGKVGDWKNYFTDEQNVYVDHLYKEKIVGTGLDFDFEIDNA